MISKKFAKRRKDSAVSPVIATILMVAITVVLAAVLYVMVSGFTHNPGSSQSVGMTSVQNTTTAGGYVISVSSTSTSNIAISGLKIVVTGSSGMDGSYALSATSAATGAGAAGLYILSGNSATYLNVGDNIAINPGTSDSLSGATVTLYSGNSQLGTVTL